MIILIYLILLFKSFFSVFIYQNSEEIQLEENHIKRSLYLFCQTYKNEFWGEHLKNNDGEKQRALLQEINKIFNEKDLITLKKILKSAFICSIEKKKMFKNLLL